VFEQQREDLNEPWLLSRIGYDKAEAVGEPRNGKLYVPDPQPQVGTTHVSVGFVNLKFTAPSWMEEPPLSNQHHHGLWRIVGEVTKINDISTLYGECTNTIGALPLWFRGNGNKPHNTRVLVKIETGDAFVANNNVQNSQSFLRWYNSKRIEANIHRVLSSAPSIKIPGCTKQLDAKKHIPQFYFAGLFQNRFAGGDNRWWFVQVMSFVQGGSLKRALMDSKGWLKAKEYVQIERAFCSLWANGIVHADAHSENILYNKSAGTKNEDDRPHARLIDFGLAVRMPQGMKMTVREKLAAAIDANVRSLAEIFKPQDTTKPGLKVNSLQNHVNGTMVARGYTQYYNADYTTVLYMYNRVENKQDVPSARKAAWECGVRAGEVGTSKSKFPAVPTRR
jgi:serine/threonine protein kinase